MLRASLGGRDDITPYKLDGAAILRDFAASGRRYEQPEVLVLDYAVWRVYEDGSSLHYVHQIVKVQSEEAVDSQGEFSPPEGGVLLRLQTIKPDGTRLEPDIIPGKEEWSKPVGEWNETRIVVKGSKVTLYLNGTVTADVDTTTDEFKALLDKSKFKGWEHFNKAAKGHIVFQDHGDKVAFRSIRIKKL